MEYLTFGLIFAGSFLIGAVLSTVMFKYRAKTVTPKRVLTLSKHVDNLRIEVADLRDLYERLMTSHKRLRSSAGMAKLRAMDEEKVEEEPSEIAALRKLGLVKGPMIK